MTASVATWARSMVVNGGHEMSGTYRGKRFHYGCRGLKGKRPHPLQHGCRGLKGKRPHLLPNGNADISCCCQCSILHQALSSSSSVPTKCLQHGMCRLAEPYWSLTIGLRLRLRLRDLRREEACVASQANSGHSFYFFFVGDEEHSLSLPELNRNRADIIGEEWQATIVY